MNTERVTYRPEGQRARTLLLQNVREGRVLGGEVLIGEEIDANGSPVLPMGKDGESVRLHFISAELVVRRVPVVMDRIYGEFVEVV